MWHDVKDLFQCNGIGNATEGDITRLNHVGRTDTLPGTLSHKVTTLQQNQSINQSVNQ